MRTGIGSGVKKNLALAFNRLRLCEILFCLTFFCSYVKSSSAALCFPRRRRRIFQPPHFQRFFAFFRVWEIRFLFFLSFPLGPKKWRWQKSASIFSQKSVYFWKMRAFLKTDKRGNIKANIVPISFSLLSPNNFSREKSKHQPYADYCRSHSSGQ